MFKESGTALRALRFATDVTALVAYRPPWGIQSVSPRLAGATGAFALCSHAAGLPALVARARGVLGLADGGAIRLSMCFGFPPAGALPGND